MTFSEMKLSLLKRLIERINLLESINGGNWTVYGEEIAFSLTDCLPLAKNRTENIALSLHEIDTVMFFNVLLQLYF